MDPGLDRKLAAQWLQEGLAPDGDFLPAALQRRKELTQKLGSAIQAALATPPPSGFAEKGILRKASIAERPGYGRVLLAEQQQARGSVVLKEKPAAVIPLSPEGLGPGGLCAETALALQLWKRKLSGGWEEGAGAHATLRRELTVVAAMCAAVLAPASEKAVAEEICQWLGRVRVNAVAVTSLADSEGVMESTKTKLAFYPTLASCVNHDCRPSALLRFQKEVVEVVVVAAEGVGAGEEVTISYGPCASGLPRFQRRSALENQYGFQCSCPACLDDCEDFSWRQRAEAHDKHAQEAVRAEDWRRAVTACKASLSELAHGYCAGDIEPLREECKLAGLLLRSGDAQQARFHWARAAALLRPVVSKADPDLEEAEEMLKRIPQEVDPARARFCAASSHGEVGKALTLMHRAVQCGGSGKQAPAGAPTTAPTQVSDDFTGTILGLGSLGLSPAELARVQAAMSG